MKIPAMKTGLASTAMLLALVSGSHALPGWLQPRQVEGRGAFVPRQYDVYGTPEAPAYGHYSYGGYGPQPTISTTSEISSVSSDSGEATSSSDPGELICTWIEHVFGLTCASIGHIIWIFF